MIAAALGLSAVTCPATGSAVTARGDFNGDGWADLAVGAPYEDDAGGANAGAVTVIYGSASGLAASGFGIPASQHWSQRTAGVPGASEADDQFGAALASGDFNADGFSDLAIGVPGEVFLSGGAGFNGMVVVIFGSASGLSTDPASGARESQSFSLAEVADPNGQLLLFAANTQADLPTHFQRFGSSLASGDFNGDGIGDLAVGAPEATVDAPFPQAHASGGAVAIFYGVRVSGLTPARTQLWTQHTGISDDPEDDDRFGAALTAGDFNGDQRTDLAIGIPGERTFAGVIGPAYKGAVAMLFGTPGGLSEEGELFIASESFSYVAFGTVLAAGDFDGNGRASLVVSLPTSVGGAVFVFDAGIQDARWLDQEILFGPGHDEPGDTFGHALAVGDFNGDGRADLAIGAPYEDLGNITDAGEVTVVYGSTSGLATNSAIAQTRGVPPPQRWNQDSSGIADSPHLGDRFGSSLTAGNFGRNQTLPGVPLPRVVRAADLAIGVPFESVGGIAGAGAVNVLHGGAGDRFTAAGLSSSNNQFWTQNSTGTNPSEANDRFGQALE